MTKRSSSDLQLLNQPSVSVQPTTLSEGLPAAPPATLQGLNNPPMYKNRLHEFTQRSSIPLPVYETSIEGSLKAFRFRSTAVVDGTSYTSSNSFSSKSAAEQDAAKYALENLNTCPNILEDTVFCKLILHEFAVKMDLDVPSYTTTGRPEGLLPTFKSSLVFDGVTYHGQTGRNKKEAEQLAARAAILSLLEDSRYKTFVLEIIKSKAKLYAALDKSKDSSVSHLGATCDGARKR